MVMYYLRFVFENVVNIEFLNILLV